MKISIMYFSGSGNTKYIADRLKSKLEDIGFSVKANSIEEKISFNDDIDLIVIGGPIYAGNVPEKLIKWLLRNVPNTINKTKAIVYSTSAGLINANGVDSLASKLEKKGYEVIGKETYVMPKNFYFGKYKRNTEEEIEVMFTNVESQIDVLVKNIENNNIEKINNNNKSIVSKDILAEVFSIMAKFMGKSFSTSDMCNGCGLCAKQCPQNNIIIKNKVVKFKNKCMMCTRCIHSCPNNAIRYKKQQYPQYKIESYINKNK